MYKQIVSLELRERFRLCLVAFDLLPHQQSGFPLVHDNVVPMLVIILLAVVHRVVIYGPMVIYGMLHYGQHVMMHHRHQAVIVISYIAAFRRTPNIFCFFLAKRQKTLL